MRRNAQRAGKRRLLPPEPKPLLRALGAFWLLLSAVGLAGLVPAAGAATNWTVLIGANGYSPSSITIHVGDTVTWQLPASVTVSTHTVTADSGAFSSGVLTCGLAGLGCVGGPATFSFTFNTPGTYPYHDSMVSGMHGTVIVVANSPSPRPSPSPAPSPSPSPSPSPTPTPSPTGSPTPSGSATQTPSGSSSTASPGGANLPTSGASGGGGMSGPAVVALIAAVIAVLCAGGLFLLRRSGAW
ncbi:MAG: cupredoxin domain-containing protein [Actinomycetota bacterium]